MKNKLLIAGFCLAGILLALNSCTVSKRQYRKGYHLVWNAKIRKTMQALATRKQARENREDEVFQKLALKTEYTDNLEREQFSFAASEPAQVNYNPKMNSAEKDSCGDRIVFRDGSEQRVKIVEVQEGMVKYLPCNNLGGPLRVAGEAQVFMIEYANGLKEVFKEEQKLPQPGVTAVQPIAQKKLNGFALASFITSMFSFLLIPGVIALILGEIALQQMRLHPDKYKGKWMAVTGSVIGGVATAILLVILLLAL